MSIYALLSMSVVASYSAFHAFLFTYLFIITPDDSETYSTTNSKNTAIQKLTSSSAKAEIPREA